MDRVTVYAAGSILILCRPLFFSIIPNNVRQTWFVFVRNRNTPVLNDHFNFLVTHSQYPISDSVEGAARGRQRRG